MPTARTTEKRETRRQTFTGVVVSDKMKDTCIVMIERYVMHPKYRKYMTRKTRIMAHDAGNTKKIGNKATVEACKPMSKNKAFKVVA